MSSIIDKANAVGDWPGNKEMNPAANSSVTENGVLEREEMKEAGGDWRDDQEESELEMTGDPGRTPGKAEGVRNPEINGNE